METNQVGGGNVLSTKKSVHDHTPGRGKKKLEGVPQRSGPLYSWERLRKKKRPPNGKKKTKVTYSSERTRGEKKKMKEKPPNSLNGGCCVLTAALINQ